MSFSDKWDEVPETDVTSIVQINQHPKKLSENLIQNNGPNSIDRKQI